jgi:effector-binding domain-containing protein
VRFPPSTGASSVHEVRVVTTQPRPTAVVACATTWEEFPSRWMQLLDQVYAFLKSGGATQDGHNIMLYKDDVPNVEVGVEVSGPFTSADPVVASVLPEGVAATTLHRGPYDRLGDAHRAIHTWCSTHGRALAGPRWEIYGDWHEDPAQLETEVFYLLR